MAFGIQFWGENLSFRLGLETFIWRLRDGLYIHESSTVKVPPNHIAMQSGCQPERLFAGPSMKFFATIFAALIPVENPYSQEV